MGKIHSLETFGTVDGPGVRFVVFFQGCPMRCQYCHNPDTWKIEDGEEMTADEIIDRFERNRSFYQTGGITATGGEPMLQLDFLTELFTKAKEKGIHTCLDTSGIMFPKKHTGTDQISEREISLTGISENMASDKMEKTEQLMSVTDLVMLDIKHINDEEHQKLTGQSNSNILAFAKYLDSIGKPVWIRHVVVPGITFDEKELTELGMFLKTLRNVEKLEVLPYHSMGKGQVRQPWHGLCFKRYTSAYQSRSKGSGTHHPGSNGTIAGEVGFMKNIFFEEKYLQISFFAI